MGAKGSLRPHIVDTMEPGELRTEFTIAKHRIIQIGDAAEAQADRLEARWAEEAKKGGRVGATGIATRRIAQLRKIAADVDAYLAESQK